MAKNGKSKRRILIWLSVPACILLCRMTVPAAAADQPTAADQAGGPDGAARPLPAGQITVTYLAPGSRAPVEQPFVKLAGDGSGKIVAAPEFLQPKAHFELTPLGRGLGRDSTFYFLCAGMSPIGVRAGQRSVTVTDSAGRPLAEAPFPVQVRGGGKRQMDNAGFVLKDPAGNETCRIKGVFDDKRTGTFNTQFETGGYSGAEVSFMSGTFSYSKSATPFSGNSTWHGLARDGRFTLTWRTRGGKVTLEVNDFTRGRNVPFSRYIDDDGWGFEPPGCKPENYNGELGIAWTGDEKLGLPRERRSTLLAEYLPADTREEFFLYLDGQHWNFFREGGLSLPEDGTVMTLTTAFGEWNEARTEFTQYPNPIHPGDRWKVQVRTRSETAGGENAAASPAAYDLEGLVLEYGSGMTCVTLHLEGLRVNETATTGHEGIFHFDNLPEGSYTLIPFKTGYTFDPAGQEIVIQGRDLKLEAISAALRQAKTFAGDTLSCAGVLLASVPSGNFRMGQDGVAAPRHRVALDAFLIGVYEITQAQFQSVMGRNPSAFSKGGDYPVEQVDWYGAAAFCNHLSRIAGLAPCYDSLSWECDFSRDGFRLPSEAEWEYACRASSQTNYYTGCDKSDLVKVGWYGEEFDKGGATHPVGRKAANSWGLSDTHGNVWEWCSDWYRDYGADSLYNPSGPRRGSLKVMRGGAWDSDSWYCRSAARQSAAPGSYNANIGFRVVRRP